MVHDEVSPPQNVLVVGGGIGGLATALSLRRAGRPVTVVEQAAEFGEIGAGLQLGPNATRILGSWGLMDAVRAVGVQPRRIVLRDAVSGEELAAMPVDDELVARYGAPYVVIHRTDLHAILLAACEEAGVELHTGTRVVDVVQHDDGTVARTEDGRVLTAAATIGADGLRSALRGEIVGDDVVPSGYVAYRGTVPVEEVPEAGTLDDVVCWVAPHGHVVQYRLRGGSVLNLVATFRSPGFARGEEDYGTPEELDEVFAGCDPQVRDAVARVGRQRRWPLFDREPAPFWGSGRVVLTGDAAHPMLQYLAQGCCQALEDAATLGHLVAEADAAALPTATPSAAPAAPTAPTTAPTDWPDVVRRFTAVRVPRTAEVQRRARLFGEVCHADGTARLLRNALLAGTDDLSVFTDWLYAGSVAERLGTPDAGTDARTAPAAGDDAGRTDGSLPAHPLALA